MNTLLCVQIPDAKLVEAAEQGAAAVSELIVSLINQMQRLRDERRNEDRTRAQLSMLFEVSAQCTHLFCRVRMHLHFDEHA